eukprot:756048-Hanusia_phi.AAC.2
MSYFRCHLSLQGQSFSNFEQSDGVDCGEMTLPFHLLRLHLPDHSSTAIMFRQFSANGSQSPTSASDVAKDLTTRTGRRCTGSERQEMEEQ